jgi:hypothetical protein
MSKKILSLLVVMLLSLTGCYTQTVFSVGAVSNDISENLNLEAVATLFGDSRNLQDFEARLNDPRNQISNLDLNGDGYVDYIRVVQNYENGIYLITLQDVLGDNQYQDLATIDVTRNVQGNIRVEIIGNPYFYGSNYVIEPLYPNRPLVFSIFWNPYYRLWVSPYHWNYYPHYYRPWRCYALYRYRQHIRSYIRGPQYYRYLKSRTFHGHLKYHHHDAYEKGHPDHGFIHRNEGYRNARELHQKRGGFNHNVRSSNPNENRQYQHRSVKTIRVNKTPAKYRKTKPVRFKNNRKDYRPVKVTPTKKRNNKSYNRKVNNRKENQKVNRDKKDKKDKGGRSNNSPHKRR